MLQQTTVATVGPYFKRFLERWPDVAALAAAPLDDVLTEWAGLGYYARARNLHKCAIAVVESHGGRFPDDEAALRTLPGIGAYTAGAIAAIAFDRPAPAVDGNVERVIARHARVETALPKAKAEIAALVRPLVPSPGAGDFAQAMMDLGAMICLPRGPLCDRCPVAADCRARAAGDPEAFPRKAPKKARPERHGIAFWLRRPDGAVLVRRRPEQGLLGGMTEIPTTPWLETLWDAEDALGHLPVAATALGPVAGRIEHVFTHFRLTLTVLAGTSDRPAPADARWCPADELHAQALPTLMRKVVRHMEKRGTAGPLFAEDGSP
ncbi:A/G-specific adenine glycosylase [Oceanibacterium hippocampi]|uniref:Adenine DNA glycosylase n=2 Tax=Oceanibacterium hippocampi TaxID=745714 RepID=A0A1Y5SB02_9PROT|nr:A/G-specific adenine glycosylase [Oceanibacterium hippocampi]